MVKNLPAECYKRRLFAVLYLARTGEFSLYSKGDNNLTFESAENRYEIIKDEDKRSTERLNEFAEIFSCIYSQNENLQVICGSIL